MAAVFLGQTEYKEYDPANPTPSQVALGRELEKRNPELALQIKTFEGFSMVVYHGFKNVTYLAHIAKGGYFFWITEEHAKYIGRALRSTLKSLCITVSTIILQLANNLMLAYLITLVQNPCIFLTAQ